jgi:hypothetical protein
LQRFTQYSFFWLGIGNPTSYIVNPAEETVVIDNDSLNDLSDGSSTESEDDLDYECIEELEIMQSSGNNADCTTENISAIERKSSSNSDYSEEGMSGDSEAPDQQDIAPETTVGKITGVYIYSDSQLRFRRQRWKSKGRKSKDPEVRLARKKNLLSYALRTAWNMQLNGIMQCDRTDDSLEEQSLSLAETFTVPLQFQKGWAKRPKNGLMYGPKHVQSYRADIYELYKLGEEDKKNKRSPAQMREALQMKYPEEFCLPSENDIRVEINRLQTKKKSPQATSRVEKTTDVYSEYIRNLAKNNCQLKPKEAVKLITENFPRKDHPELPCDSRLSRKFSYQKRCVTMQKKKSQSNV